MVERAFRKLYDKIRMEKISRNRIETFEMTPIFHESIFCVAFSRKIVLLPYGLISIITVIILICNTK